MSYSKNNLKDDTTDGNWLGKGNNIKTNKEITDGSFKYVNFDESHSKSSFVRANDEEEIWYNMKHKNRNVALIFNHANFTCGKDSRYGTDVDCLNLESTFKDLGFNPIPYHDKKLKKICKIVDQWSQYDFTDCDCLIVAILSHGFEEHIYAKDQAYNLKTVFLDKFAENKCISLSGKPKIFFIQACQGKLLDDGVSVTTQVDGANCMTPEYLSPDFLIAYSSIYGYLSWRNEKTGSWFINELCNALKKFRFEKDIYGILTYVMCQVATKYETNKMDEELYKKKQSSCIISTLTRLIKFENKGF
ncbi:caspase-like [Adelges cooleyi]|uniref:caspase-like n=1 Tax=Adelges cooleyi TaxID=133065 RepID=UPI00218029AC|nr:caspase-like [Adelges cooleyi]